VVFMLVPFSTTVHSITRQMRIKTQNMIVFTVEFTRTPLSQARGTRIDELQPPPHP